MKLSMVRIAALARISVAVTGVVTPLLAQSLSLSWNRDFPTAPFPARWSLACASFATPDGPELFVGGDYWTQGDPADWVVRWSPTQGWRGLGPPYMNDLVTDLIIYDDNTGPALYACGWFTQPYQGIQRWKASTGWRPLTAPGYSALHFGGPNHRRAMTVHDDGNGAKLYIGGAFGGATSTPQNIVVSRGVIAYDSSGWHSLAGGVDDGEVHALLTFDDGSGAALIIAGSFTSIGGQPIRRIARWQNDTWSAMGDIASDYPQVSALGILDTGLGPTLYATGHTGTTYLQRWTGSNWIPTAMQPTGPITDLIAFDDGRGPALFCKVVGPGGEAQRFDGTNWSTLGQGVTGIVVDPIEDFTIHDAGRGPELHMCGGMYLAGGNVSSYGIASWANLQPGITRLCSGDGSFTPCPCASSFGAIGRGCANSADPGGGDLAASGAARDDSLAFAVTSLPASSSVLFFQGDAFQSDGHSYSGGYTPFFGDGLRCTRGTIRRLYTRAASGGQVSVPDAGAPTVRARANALGDPLPAGASRYYQARYRDLHPTFCVASATSNTTNAIRVVW